MKHTGDQFLGNMISLSYYKLASSFMIVLKEGVVRRELRVLISFWREKPTALTLLHIDIYHNHIWFGKRKHHFFAVVVFRMTRFFT